MNMGTIIMCFSMAVSLALAILGGWIAMRARKFLVLAVMCMMALLVTCVGFVLSLNLRNYEFNMENMCIREIIKEDY